MIVDTFRIEHIDNASPHLRTVMELGRAHRSTLGFLPAGAFDDHARRRRIIVALDLPTDRCIGYLLYRCTDNRVTIVHLCVDPEFRGKGIARRLVESLSSATSDLLGIGLRCRRDYDVTSLWPSLGFTALSEKAGRSKDSKPLVFWWRDHGHPTLFSGSTDSLLSGRILVTIDKNVFVDLQDEHSPETEESRSLLADWLPDIELCITDELFNEILRDDNTERRELQRRLASGYTQLSCPTGLFEHIYESLRPLFPRELRVQDDSDLRHISMAAGAGAKFFVSRDEGLLRKSDAVYETCQMLIMRPADVITHLDQVLREEHYQPTRLAGTRIERGHIMAGHENELAETFCVGPSETRPDFLSRIRRLLADPRMNQCIVVRNEDGEMLSFVVLSRTDPHTLEIPLIRVSAKPLAHTLVRTLARYMLFHCIAISSGESRSSTCVTDDHITATMEEVLAEEMFCPGSMGWMKLNPRFVGTTADLRIIIPDMLSAVPPEYTDLGRLPYVLQEHSMDLDAHMAAYIERVLWPAKLTDAALPSFIVPIRPTWAQHLFDEGLARQNLFGADTSLALQRESVYYRRMAASRGIAAPARILWYVSHDQAFDGSGGIRACSYLEEVVSAPAREAYRRFRRYGVYTWEDLRRLTDEDMSMEVMVLRFRDTELFTTPIPWGQTLWDMIGRVDTMQSPTKISADAFRQLYRYGTARASS